MKVRTWASLVSAPAVSALVLASTGPALAGTPVEVDVPLPLPIDLPVLTEEGPGPVQADDGALEAQSTALASPGAPLPRRDVALEGVFKIDAGRCEEAGVTDGSYFRMVNPGGSADAGPYTGNSSSGCGDRSWTRLEPGTDGGLSTVDYQPHPDPAFTGAGGGAAGRIVKPVPFNGIAFAIATNAKDPQTATAVPVPSISDGGGSLSGDLRAVGAAWNRMHFNQGTPKPNGSKPGATSGPTGTYDQASGAYVLEWSSTIEGGPFNNFTGVWHLEGTFTATAAAHGPTSTVTSPADTVRSATGEEVRAATAQAPSGTERSHSATDEPLPRTGGLPLLAPGLAAVAAGLGARSRRACGGRQRARS